MTKQANALSFEQAKNLLPNTFKDVKSAKVGRMRSIYSSSLGYIDFHSSKDYGWRSTTWWYTISDKVINLQVAFLLLAADYSGVFLIPLADFIDYRKKNSPGRVKGGEKINIIRREGRYIRKEANCEEWDLTKYFIKNDNMN